METEPHDFLLFPGDYSSYTLRCMRCGQHVTVVGSIGETQVDAPSTMLYHWNMIQSHDKNNHRESMLTPVLLSKPFQVGLKFGCQKPTKYRLFMFYEAVKVDIANSKETSFNNTISSTLSLITVLFEDLFETINIHKEFHCEKEGPIASITSLNKANTCDGYYW